MSVFSSKKTQQGVYAAEEAKEKTQTESNSPLAGSVPFPFNWVFVEYIFLIVRSFK